MRDVWQQLEECRCLSAVEGGVAISFPGREMGVISTVGSCAEFWQKSKINLLIYLRIVCKSELFWAPSKSASKVM